jgi:hypothetical protein
MVTRFIALVALSPLSLFANFFGNEELLENNVSPKLVKTGLELLGFLKEEENQVRLINEVKPNLTSGALFALYDSSEEGSLFLKKLLETRFDKDQRQNLIDSLNEKPSIPQ